MASNKLGVLPKKDSKKPLHSFNGEISFKDTKALSYLEKSIKADQNESYFAKSYAFNGRKRNKKSSLVDRSTLQTTLRGDRVEENETKHSGKPLKSSSSVEDLRADCTVTSFDRLFVNGDLYYKEDGNCSDHNTRTQTQDNLRTDSSVSRDVSFVDYVDPKEKVDNEDSGIFFDDNTIIESHYNGGFAGSRAGHNTYDLSWNRTADNTDKVTKSITDNNRRYKWRRPNSERAHNAKHIDLTTLLQYFSNDHLNELKDIDTATNPPKNFAESCDKARPDSVQDRQTDENTEETKTDDVIADISKQRQIMTQISKEIAQKISENRPQTQLSSKSSLNSNDKTKYRPVVLKDDVTVSEARPVFLQDRQTDDDTKETKTDDAIADISKQRQIMTQISKEIAQKISENRHQKQPSSKSPLNSNVKTEHRPVVLKDDVTVSEARHSAVKSDSANTEQMCRRTNSEQSHRLKQNSTRHLLSYHSLDDLSRESMRCVEDADWWIRNTGEVTGKSANSASWALFEKDDGGISKLVDVEETYFIGKRPGFTIMQFDEKVCNNKEENLCLVRNHSDKESMAPCKENFKNKDGKNENQSFIHRKRFTSKIIKTRLDNNVYFPVISIKNKEGFKGGLNSAEECSNEVSKKQDDSAANDKIDSMSENVELQSTVLQDIREVKVVRHTVQEKSCKKIEYDRTEESSYFFSERNTCCTESAFENSYVTAESLASKLSNKNSGYLIGKDKRVKEECYELRSIVHEKDLKQEVHTVQINKPERSFKKEGDRTVNEGECTKYAETTLSSSPRVNEYDYAAPCTASLEREDKINDKENNGDSDIVNCKDKTAENQLTYAAGDTKFSKGRRNINVNDIKLQIESNLDNQTKLNAKKNKTTSSKSNESTKQSICKKQIFFERISGILKKKTPKKEKRRKLQADLTKQKLKADVTSNVADKDSTDGSNKQATEHENIIETHETFAKSKAKPSVDIQSKNTTENRTLTSSTTEEPIDLFPDKKSINENDKKEIKRDVKKLLKGKKLQNKQKYFLALVLWAIEADMPEKVFSSLQQSASMKTVIEGLASGHEELLMYHLYST